MNLEDNKKAFMELLRIPSVTGSGADGEEKACAFLEHILQENGIKNGADCKRFASTKPSCSNSCTEG